MTVLWLLLAVWLVAAACGARAAEPVAAVLPEVFVQLPLHRRRGLGCDPARRTFAQARLASAARRSTGNRLPAFVDLVCFAHARGEAAGRVVAIGFSLGVVSSVFDNIPLSALALKQGGYDWGMLAYAVGFGGSMI